ncbi:MAG: DUF6282 family protein [Pigmentiphaga sp.]|nr:DUF6282 family protein [Pigmentiphaga sp.]
MTAIATPKTAEDLEGITPELAARIDALMVGAIDMHCHSGPSVMPRRLDHIEAIEEAAGAGMRGLLFKDHFYSATPVVELLKPRCCELNLRLFSGVPLNDTAGGLNPYAVDHGLKLGADLVWMPTFSAANHIRNNHRKKMLQTKLPMLPATMLTVVDEKGRLKDVVKQILDQIAEFDAVLSAGHLHISEIWPLFEEAKQRGVNRRLVQHPTYTIGASLADIRELISDGNYIEHSLCMFIEESRFKHWDADELQEIITAGTVERTILGSDLGQIKNPTPVTGFRSVIKLLIELGYADDDIRKLVGGNASRLLGLDEKTNADAQA